MNLSCVLYKPYRNYFYPFTICITFNFELVHVPTTVFVYLVSTYFYIYLPFMCILTSVILFPI